MNYSIASITTPADCDVLLTMANKEKGDLTYLKTTLERKQASYAENAIELESEFQAATAEAAAISSIIAALPEGDTKDDNITRQKKLELKLFLLAEKKEHFGSIALLDKQYDQARVEKQLEETESYITALQARKAALQQAA